MMRGIHKVALTVFGLFLMVTAQAQSLQPFVLASSASKPLAQEIERVRTALDAAGFDILGEYAPFDGAHVIAISHDGLRTAAAASEWGGFGAAIHVGLTEVGEAVQVSYMNPAYMAAAYRMSALTPEIADTLKAALGAEREFGTREGRSAEALSSFHYMIGMEYFTDPYELATHASHAEALKVVEDNLAKAVGGTALVYKLAIPGTEQVLFGVSRAQVEDKRANDRHILADTVDQDAELKTTPYLPYQMLVVGDEVLALHMRFRMAVYHPDLTMGTFGKLMSSPGAIEDLLRKVAGGESRRKFSF